MLLPRRLVPIALASAITGAVTVGAAATLPTSSSELGAGGAVVAPCDGGGITVTYVGAPGSVTALQISGLDAGCDGGVAHATVTDSTGDDRASGSATVSGGTAIVPLSPARPAEVVAGWHLVVVTP